MSLGWLVAAVKIAPDKLTGSERAVLVGLAEATPKGARKSLATQDELMSIAGLKSRNGIDKVIRGLVERGFVRHERARLGHAAAYELLFDEWVYDETSRELRHPQVTQSKKVASPTGDATPETADQHASPVGDATRELRHLQGKVASPVGDVSPLLKKDSLLSLAGRLRAAGVSEAEEREIIEWISKGRPDVRSPRAYLRTVAGNGDLPGLVAEWRQAAGAATPAAGAGLPEWCGRCGLDSMPLPDGRPAAAVNLRLRFVDTRGTPCPDCHPAGAAAS